MKLKKAINLAKGLSVLVLPVYRLMQIDTKNFKETTEEAVNMIVSDFIGVYPPAISEKPWDINRMIGWIPPLAAEGVDIAYQGLNFLKKEIFG